MRYTIKLLQILLFLFLTACAKYHVNSSPVLHLPSVLLHGVSSATSHINTKKEMSGYLVDEVNLCKKREQILLAYQDNFNKHLLSK